ncbi:MAG: pilin [Candidatus Paceibacterota bacterium]
MKKIISVGAVLGVVSPMLVLAADDVNAFTIFRDIAQLLAYVIPVLITLAVVYFIWGVIQYTVSTDEEAKKGARGKIIQGLIGLFIIVAFWGILSLITSTFGVGPEQLDPRDIPCIPNPNAGITC